MKLLEDILTHSEEFDELELDCLVINDVKFKKDFGPWLRDEEVASITFNFEEGSASEHDDAGKVVRSCLLKLSAREEPVAPGQPCCQMRVKMIVMPGPYFSEAKCGIPDSVLADFILLGESTPSGKSIISFKFCPWCGKPYVRDGVRRIIDICKPASDEESGEEWKK